MNRKEQSDLGDFAEQGPEGDAFRKTETARRKKKKRECAGVTSPLGWGVQVLSESTGEPIEVLCGLFATGLIATTIALLALKKEKKQQITTKKNQTRIQAFRISCLKLQPSKVTSGKKPCSFSAQ